MTASQETVFLHGHIIDSLILAKVLDTILMMGGSFDLNHVTIGATREAPSEARITVRAPSGRLLSDILRAIQPHGATVEGEGDCRFEPAPAAGVFPEEKRGPTNHLDRASVPPARPPGRALRPPRARSLPMACFIDLILRSSPWCCSRPPRRAWVVLPGAPTYVASRRRDLSCLVARLPAPRRHHRWQSFPSRSRPNLAAQVEWSWSSTM